MRLRRKRQESQRPRGQRSRLWLAGKELAAVQTIAGDYDLPHRVNGYKPYGSSLWTWSLRASGRVWMRDLWAEDPDGRKHKPRSDWLCVAILDPVQRMRLGAGEVTAAALLQEIAAARPGHRLTTAWTPAGKPVRPRRSPGHGRSRRARPVP